MKPTPTDMLQYVLNEELEADFLVALSLHKQNYSIGEIADKTFEKKDGQVYLCSNQYNLHTPIQDDDILTAIHNGLYVSVFIARKDDSYQLHFLVSQYPVSMKAQFDELIAREVVQYMILKTIIALRLDSEEKIKEYLCIEK